MLRKGLVRTGTGVVALIIMLLSVLSLSYANESTQNSSTEKCFHAAPQSDLNQQINAIKPEDVFFGRLWGSKPETIPDTKFITDLTPNLMAYSLDLDVSSIMGSVPTYSCLQMIFSKEEGLVQAHISFDTTEYERVEAQLEQVLGMQSPIIYELMASRGNSFREAEWLVGKNTRVVLLLSTAGASIEISKRDFARPKGADFTEQFAVAMLKQAEEYSKENRIVEASSLYQNLLNGTDAYQFFTQMAQEHLVLYSGRHAAVEYLGEDGGFAFYGFRNSFSDYSGQQWVRVDLDAAAQEKMQKQRPMDSNLQNELTNISMILCRVRNHPISGQFSVVEQIWVNDTNRIIGGSPAWASQNTSWPVPYINQVCEIFLRKWLSIEHTAGPIHCK